MKRTGPTNAQLKSLIVELKKTAIEQKVPLWKRIAKDLERPTRIRRSVNIMKIVKHTRDGETAIVPGKVLSLGTLEKKMTIAAFQYSAAAKEKIAKAGGTVLTIHELLLKNPKGQKVRIIG